MPELPEVETTVRLLRPQLEGRTLGMVRVHWPRTLGGMSAKAFAAAVHGARVRSLKRRAKYMVVELERDGAPAGSIVVHLRMTGRLYVDPPHTPADPFVKVEVELDCSHWLRFLDVRKFGRFQYAKDPEDVLPELGPEPLGAEFSSDWLHRSLRERRRRIKPLLLDQAFVAGLGNIYADEALHLAGIHPLALASRIERTRSDRLHAAIRSTLAAAIEREGSSFDRFYRTPEGKPGSYQHQFLVYGREGLPCRTCGREIERIVVGQRGTHLCRHCQKR